MTGGLLQVTNNRFACTRRNQMILNCTQLFLIFLSRVRVILHKPVCTYLCLYKTVFRNDYKKTNLPHNFFMDSNAHHFQTVTCLYKESTSFVLNSLLFLVYQYIFPTYPNNNVIQNETFCQQYWHVTFQHFSMLYFYILTNILSHIHNNNGCELLTSNTAL